MAAGPGLLAFSPVFAAGLVPCGGPGQEPCNICFFFKMVEQATEFIAFTIVPLLTAAALLLAGCYILLSQGNPDALNKGRKVIYSGVIGFLIVFAGWVAVNTFFMAMGVTEWTGLEKGWWKIKMSCGMPEKTAGGCGDGIVQHDEDCDPKETVVGCQNRIGSTAERCEEIIAKCDKDCELPAPASCDKDSNLKDWDKLGMGCYLDTNNNGKIDDSECRKGKFICDPNANGGKGEIVCANVYGDEEYTKPQYQLPEYGPAADYTGKDSWYVTDYCCENMMAEYADGKIGDKPFTIVRATVADLKKTGGKKLMTSYAGIVNLDSPAMGTGLAGGFNCDEICRKFDKICVGVGLTDPSKNACVYEVHDIPGIPTDAERCNNAGVSIISMQLSSNQARNNCKAHFGFLYYSHDGQRWSTGYDKYEYFCTMHDPRSYHGSRENLVGIGKMSLSGMKEVPDGSCGVCKPKPAAGEDCAGANYKQDPADSCAFHGNDLGETACYCY